MRQPPQPLAQQRVDLLGAQSIADPLEAFGVITPQHAVVQRLETDPFGGQLLFGVFMPVDAQLGCIRKVAAELEKERAEIAIHTVDVELIHHRRGLHQPRISRSCLFVPATLRPEHPRLLLRLADEHHTFRLVEFLPVRSGNVVLALAFQERHHRYVLSLGKVLQRFYEGLADRIHQSAGGELMPTVKPEEGGHSLFALQLRHVDVQVHPVDSFHLEGDRLFQHFGDGAWYAHFRLRLTPALRDHLPLCGPMTEPVSGSLLGRGQLSDYRRCHARTGIHLVGLRRSLVSGLVQ